MYNFRTVLKVRDLCEKSLHSACMPFRMYSYSSVSRLTLVFGVCDTLLSVFGPFLGRETVFLCTRSRLIRVPTVLSYISYLVDIIFGFPRFRPLSAILRTLLFVDVCDSLVRILSPSQIEHFRPRGGRTFFVCQKI